MQVFVAALAAVSVGMVAVMVLGVRAVVTLVVLRWFCCAWKRGWWRCVGGAANHSQNGSGGAVW